MNQHTHTQSDRRPFEFTAPATSVAVAAEVAKVTSQCKRNIITPLKPNHHDDGQQYDDVASKPRTKPLYYIDGRDQGEIMQIEFVMRVL